MLFRWFHILFALLLAAVVLGHGVARAQDGSSSTTQADAASPFDGMVFFCTKCMKEVPEQLGAGSKCPHCGAFFESATNADGSETKAAPIETGISLRVWAGIALVVLFAGEYLFRRWRRANVS